MKLTKDNRPSYILPEKVICGTCGSEYTDLQIEDLVYVEGNGPSYDYNPDFIAWNCEVCSKRNLLIGVPQWWIEQFKVANFPERT